MKLKHSLLFTLCATFFMLTASDVQGQNRQKGRPSQKVTITGVAAQRWKEFYPRFIAAVKRRDRSYLRTIMDDNFTYSFGDGANAEKAFRYIDDPNNYGGRSGWKVLEGVLAKGVVPDVENMRSGSRRPSYIAPPRAGRGYRSGFEFIGGGWHWMYFVGGD